MFSFLKRLFCNLNDPASHLKTEEVRRKLVFIDLLNQTITIEYYPRGHSDSTGLLTVSDRHGDVLGVRDTIYLNDEQRYVLDNILPVTRAYLGWMPFLRSGILDRYISTYTSYVAATAEVEAYIRLRFSDLSPLELCVPTGNWTQAEVQALGHYIYEDFSRPFYRTVCKSFPEFDHVVEFLQNKDGQWDLVDSLNQKMVTVDPATAKKLYLSSGWGALVQILTDVGYVQSYCPDWIGDTARLVLKGGTPWVLNKPSEKTPL